MFATGVGGVHGWEISIEQFNSFMLVSCKTIIYLCIQRDSLPSDCSNSPICMATKIPQPTGHLYRINNLHTLWILRQNFSTRLLSPAFPSAVV